MKYLWIILSDGQDIRNKGKGTGAKAPGAFFFSKEK